MRKLTMQEYANEENISLVTVNKRINKGVINSTKENGRRFIILDNEKEDDIIELETKNLNKSLETSLETVYKERINDLLRMNKQLMKQNKQLMKENKELNNESKGVYKQFINEMKLLTAPNIIKKKKS